MEDELELCIEETKERMDNTITHLQKEFSKLRTGKASPQMLEDIFIDYYGRKTPLNQVANINIRDPKTIVIQPWDKTILDQIEKEILSANLGFTPKNNKEVIIINIPPLTEERRKEIAKKARSEAEDSKVSIRNIRREANENIKSLIKKGLSEDSGKNGENEIQKLTDKYIKSIDDMYALKEKDIMTI